jgi:hypothetical protein
MSRTDQSVNNILYSIIYNYQPCKSEIWRFVYQRKNMSPEGGINFRGETIRHITLLQGLQLFYYIEYPTQYLVHIWQQIPSDDSYSVRLYLISQRRMKSSRNIIQLSRAVDITSRAVDITMRHNVQRLI